MTQMAQTFEVTKDIDVTPIMQLVDLNGTKVNFQSDFVVSTQDPSKKILVAIVNQDQLDNGDLNFESTEEGGKYSRRVTFQQGIHKNHFLALKKADRDDTPIPCHVIVRLKELPKQEEVIKKDKNQRSNEIHKERQRELKESREMLNQQQQQMPARSSISTQQDPRNVVMERDERDDRIQRTQGIQKGQGQGQGMQRGQDQEMQRGQDQEMQRMQGQRMQRGQDQGMQRGQEQGMQRGQDQEMQRGQDQEMQRIQSQRIQGQGMQGQGIQGQRIQGQGMQGQGMQGQGMQGQGMQENFQNHKNHKFNFEETFRKNPYFSVGMICITLFVVLLLFKAISSGNIKKSAFSSK